MCVDFTRYFVQEGVELYISDRMPTRATSIYVFMIQPLSRSTITGLSMMPDLLTVGTTRYPNRQQFEEKLSELYGVQLTTMTMKRGDYHVTRFAIQIPNSRYLLETRDLMAETLQFLAEMFTYPLVRNGGFVEDAFQSVGLKQRNKIRAEYDNRRRYAMNRFIELLCEGESCVLPPHGYEEDITLLTSQAAYEMYKTTMEEGQIKIFVRGDVRHDDVLHAVESHLLFDRKNQKPLPLVEVKKNQGKCFEVCEESKGGHSVLVVGGHLGINRRYEEWVALEVAQFLLGGFPQSLLFKKLRDELGLAYYIIAHPNSIKGIAQIVIGINSKDYPIVKEVVIQEIERLQHGKIGSDEILQAIHAFVHEHVNVKEDATEHIETYLNGILAGGVRSISQRIDLLKKLKPEDVVQAAARIQPELIFLLKGADNDADEI